MLFLHYCLRYLGYLFLMNPLQAFANCNVIGQWLKLGIMIPLTKKKEASDRTWLNRLCVWRVHVCIFICVWVRVCGGLRLILTASLNHSTGSHTESRAHCLG